MARPEAGAEYSEPEEDLNPRTSGAHVLTFGVGGRVFGVPLDVVTEIIRPPRLAHMPLAPRSLLGLANLRGVVLPVVSLRLLLGLADAAPDGAARVIVLDLGSPVGFLVDRIEYLVALDAKRIDRDDAGDGSVEPATRDGVVKGSDSVGAIEILNPQRLLQTEFSRLGVSTSKVSARSDVSAAPLDAETLQPRHRLSLVSFDLAHQEYSIPLDRVREILPLPDHVSEVARAETAVLGVVTRRDRLLPLVSLRALLGLPSDGERKDRGKVVVLSIGHASVGVVVDRAREILRVDAGQIDPAPALLNRGAGDAEVTSICRLEDGRRLVAVLSPDRLFRSDLMQRILSEQTAEDGPATRSDETAMAGQQFVIFRLGSQDYGLPIAAVEEIANPPEHITRLPKAPAFIEGVVNLRGSIVPIVDLRRRFEIAASESERGRRILILGLGGGKTGFIVDGVSEVMMVPDDAIRPAPHLSQEQMLLIDRVVNLDAQNRMILLVDPAQLLDQVEADLLAKFDRNDLDQTSTKS